MKEIIIDGIPVCVTKKKMKNLYIRVIPPDGTVKISVPYGVSDEAVCRVVRSRIDWIREQRRRIGETAGRAGNRYETGESVPVWGVLYPLEVRYAEGAGSAWMWGRKVILQIRPDSTPQQREKALNEWYRAELKKMIPGAGRKCEQITGVKAKEWQGKNMKTRWGTCNVKEGRIWLNLQLAKKPPECLEYVIIHELIHLLEPSHNQRFYQLMDRFLPDWRRVHQELNGRQAPTGHKDTPG